MVTAATRYLLDSSFVSVAQRDPGVGQKLLAATPDCAIAAVVFHELSYGLARMPAGKKRRLVADFFVNVVSTLPVLPYDRSAADWHAAERARLEAAGQRRSFADGLIAATAVAHDRTLVTKNPRDFVGYRGLTVVEEI